MIPIINLLEFFSQKWFQNSGKIAIDKSISKKGTKLKRGIEAGVVSIISKR